MTVTSDGSHAAVVVRRTVRAEPRVVITGLGGRRVVRLPPRLGAGRRSTGRTDGTPAAARLLGRLDHACTVRTPLPTRPDLAHSDRAGTETH